MTGEWKQPRRHSTTVVIAPLRAAASALRDPEPQQPRQSPHSQESQCASNPTDVTSPAGIRDNAAEDGHTGTHGSDDVTNPVDEIQERALRLRPGLALDRHV